MTIYINNDLQVKIMLQFSVTLEEIKDEGFDIVAAALFDDVERKYTTDWGVTGPIIQDLGVSLNYQGADKGLKLFSRNSSERDFDWMASYGDATEFSHSPLIAAIKAIASQRSGDISIQLSHTNVSDYVIDEWTIVSQLLEGSNCHEVEEDERINFYIFISKSSENEKKMFQDLINLIEKLDGLSISEKIGPIGQVEAVIVEHI